jgi:hypothetical protein
MAAVKVLARGWKISIRTAAATFLDVKGLTTLTFNGEKNDADTTTFDSEGVQEHMVASRANSMSMEGYHLEDPVTGDRDPGQEAVEALAEKVGAGSLAIFKRVSPGGNIKYFYASANVTGVGGANDDPTGWSAELKVSGKLLEAEPA